jgi:WD domain, G-beta repeat
MQPSPGPSPPVLAEPPPPPGGPPGASSPPGAKPAEIKPSGPVVLGVRSAVFLPDGKHAVCTEGQVLSIWNLDSGKRVRKITGHHGRIDRVVLAGGGQIAVSVSQDNSARVWELKTGKQLASLSVWQQPQPQPSRGGPYGLAPARPAPPPPAKEPEEKKESRKKTKADAKKTEEVQDVPTQADKVVDGFQWNGPPPGMPGVGVASPSNPRWSFVVGVSPDGRHLLTAGGPGGPATMDNPAYIVRIWRMPEAARVTRTGPAKQ